ncbi:MAG: nitroreductase family protein [Candidatus Kapaibacteriales bacterium]
MEKLAQTLVPINSLIARRWSPRAFDPTKQVEQNKILALCEAARWAPSSGGAEPWRFIIWDKFTNPHAYSKAFESLDEGNKLWARNAPLLIGVFAFRFWDKGKDEPNKWAGFDTGSAALNILLQSFDLGLYAHTMGGFDQQKLMDSFNIPNDYDAYAIIAVGYPGNPYSLEETFLKREFNQRQRSPIGTRFFNSKWEVPIIEEQRKEN